MESINAEGNKIAPKETQVTPRTPEQIRVARGKLDTTRRFFQREAGALEVTSGWVDSLPEELRKKVEIAIGDALYQGRHEGLGFALGEDNKITDAIQQQIPIPEPRMPQE